MVPSPSKAHDVNPETLALAGLLQLGRRARQATSLAELGFIAVNETFQLTPYRQAALWLTRDGVTALSGVTTVEENAPYVLWLNAILKRLVATGALTGPEPITIISEMLTGDEAAAWNEWMPACGLWLPLPSAEKSGANGGLLMARDTPWSPHEIALLSEWAAIFAHARAFIAGKRWLPRAFFNSTTSEEQIARTKTWWSPLNWLLRKRWLLATMALAFLGSLPVSLTVLAPADLVPLNPAVIRAPLDGVVERVLVTPNQHVAEGEPLFEFDRVNLQNRLEVAIKGLATVEAEYRKTAQQAVFDPEGRSNLAVLQGQIAERTTDVDYLRQLNERGVVTAPRAGVVLFDDSTEWIGRPVVTGERVMVVADARETEIEAWLSPADVIELPPNARVKLYLNADPLTQVAARMRYVAHEAVQRPDGQFAYRLRATLEPSATRPQVGLKGTAKVEGETVSIAYWVMRRPLASARAWLGL